MYTLMEVVAGWMPHTVSRLAMVGHHAHPPRRHTPPLTLPIPTAWNARLPTPTKVSMTQPPREVQRLLPLPLQQNGWSGTSTLYVAHSFCGRIWSFVEGMGALGLMLESLDGFSCGSLSTTTMQNAHYAFCHPTQPFCHQH
jgi:hypothetical protein